MNPVYDVIVVGAGAAGLIAAGRAAELGGRVLLLEKMARAGRKLLLTGKGRCNITNTAPIEEFIQHIHPDGNFLQHAFERFFSEDIVRLLNQHGCATAVERGGRVFPVSNKSADVLDALMRWMMRHPVEICYGQRVEDLILENGQLAGLKIRSKTGSRSVRARAVILCTGGMSYPATGSTGDGYRLALAAGHAIETPRPALVPLETAGNLARRLQGLNLKNVKAEVWVNNRKSREAFGEMSVTDSGLSGPIILTMSRFIVDELLKNSRIEISVDLKPALHEAKLDARLVRDLTEYGGLRMDAICRKWLPAPLVPVLLDGTGIQRSKAGQQLTTAERRKILLWMKDVRFTITGFRPFKEAIITAGGVRSSEIDPHSMESRLVPQLYFAGELIDLDADTGGFNLQIAFSTAWLAAEASMQAWHDGQAGLAGET